MINIRYADKPTKLLISNVYHATLKHFAINEELDISVTFVGEDAIRRLNYQHRNIDKGTDVLTFPNIDVTLPIQYNKYIHDIDPETGRIFLGDIIISGKIAKKQAKEYNHSIDREVAFLTLHGILHLLGFDHKNHEEERIMIQHQNNILNNLGVIR